MTIKSIILLTYLKKVQIKEDYIVIVDDKNCCISTLWDGQPEYKIKSMKSFSGNMKSILDNLMNKGYIIKRNDLGNQLFQVTHEGWHYGEVNFYRICKEIIRSFVFPAVVALVTALVTIKLTMPPS